MKIWIIEPADTCAKAQLKDEISRLGQEMGILPSIRSEGRLREERRLYPRIPCFLLVDYATQGCAYRAFIRNISADGVFIEAHRPGSHGPDISLVISFLDDRHPVKMSGEIVRTGERGLGVRFDPVAGFLLENMPP